MTDRPDLPLADRSGTPPPDRSDPQSGPRHTDPVRWPVWIALPLIFGVFVAGAVWSFREQTELARSAGFHLPELLPLVIDGFAAAMAAVAWAASLDGRAAVLARLGIAVGVACSVGTNAAWAWERSGADRLTVILAGGVPVLAMLAFEAVLAEVRRQVQRRRGLPQPDPVPLPRALAVGLSPIRTPIVWRRLALELTDPRRQFEAVRAAIEDRPSGPPKANEEDQSWDYDVVLDEDRSEPEPDGPVGEPDYDWSLVDAMDRADLDPEMPFDGPVAEPSQEPVPEPPPDRSDPVIPIDRPRRRQTGPVRSRRTGRKGGRLDDHSPTAVRDAETVLDKYGDDVPGREKLRVQMGWGSPRAGNALAAIPAVRSARRERSTTTQPDRSESDDPESEAAAI